MDKEFELVKKNETLYHVSLPLERRDKSTFLHGKLEEDIYIEKPKGFTHDYSLACKMRKPLYQINKSPREWNSKFNSSIPSNRFERCKSSCKCNNTTSPTWNQIGRRWIGSHALYEGISAHKDHHTKLLLHSCVY